MVCRRHSLLEGSSETAAALLAAARVMSMLDLVEPG